MKTISILGSTGSIGTQTLDVVRHQNDVKVAALAAGRNIRKLEEQIREFEPVSSDRKWQIHPSGLSPGWRG